MDKYVKLAQNTGIFAIANMGSSLVSFLLVRFYTELLTAEQYGTVDMMTTTTSMLIPFLTLAIVEGVFRFSIDSNDKASVLSTGLYVTLFGNIIFSIIGRIVLGMTVYAQYSLWMGIIIFVTSFDNIFAQFVRGAGRVKIFALSGILKTILLICTNSVLLGYFGLKTEGYLISMIIGEIASAVYLFISCKCWKYLLLKPDKYVFREMITYSIPLIPSSLAWWVMNASDKYMLLYYIGIEANGIYAVAHKLPTIINLFNSLFFQAWQLSAVEESKDISSRAFYTSVFNMLAMILICIASFVLLLLKGLMSVLVADSYTDAWRYSPFLVIAMVFSAFSSFFGTNYTATKKTKGAFKTTLIGAITNLLLNYLLIRIFGINGAAFATMISFFVMWIIMDIDTSRYVKIYWNKRKLATSLCLLLFQAFVITMNVPYFYLYEFISFITIMLIYFKEMRKFVLHIINSLKVKTNIRR